MYLVIYFLLTVLGSIVITNTFITMFSAENKKIPDAPLSADEFKTRLLDTFEKSGTLDNLRAQLRGKLFAEIFKTGSLPNVTEKKEENVVTGTLLPLQISNWIVYKHLKHQGLEYTLSTFVTEAQLSNPENQMTVQDVLQLLGVDSMPIRQEELQAACFKRNFLSNFLKLLMKLKTPSFHAAKQYAKISEDKEHPNKNVQSDFHAPQVFYGEKTSREFGGGDKADSPEFGSPTSRSLKQRYDNEVQILKQKLFLELENVQAREEQSRLEIEQKKLKLDHERRIFELEKQKFQLREEEFKKQNEAFNEEKGRQIQLLQEKEVSYRNTDFPNIWDNKLKQQQNWLETEISKMKTGNQESEFLSKKLSELQTSYKSLQNEYSSVLTNNETLKAELSRMADYAAVKEELLWKSRKADSLEKEILNLKSHLQSEKMASMETIQNLQHQLMQNFTKTSQAQSNNMQPLQTSAHIRQMERLEKECQEAKQFNRAVLNRIEDQKDDIQELHRLLHVLHSEMSQRGAGCDEAKRHEFGPQGEGMTHKKFQTFSPMPSNIPQCGHLNNHATQSNRDNNPPFFISEAKQKIDNLQKETEVLENKYYEFLASGDILFPQVASYYPLSSVEPHRTSMFNKTLSTLPHAHYGNLKTPNFGTRKPPKVLSNAVIGFVPQDLHQDLSMENKGSLKQNFSEGHKRAVDFFSKDNFRDYQTVHVFDNSFNSPQSPNLSKREALPSKPASSVTSKITKLLNQRSVPTNLNATTSTLPSLSDNSFLSKYKICTDIAVDEEEEELLLKTSTPVKRILMPLVENKSLSNYAKDSVQNEQNQQDGHEIKLTVNKEDEKLDIMANVIMEKEICPPFHISEVRNSTKSSENSNKKLSNADKMIDNNTSEEDQPELSDELEVDHGSKAEELNFESEQIKIIPRQNEFQLNENIEHDAVDIGKSIPVNVAEDSNESEYIDSKRIDLSSPVEIKETNTSVHEEPIEMSENDQFNSPNESEKLSKADDYEKQKSISIEETVEHEKSNANSVENLSSNNEQSEEDETAISELKELEISRGSISSEDNGFGW